MDFISFRTTRTSGRANRFLDTLIRLTVMAAAGAAVLAMVFVGFFVVLPLMLIGGIASYFYIRRRMRQAQRAAQNDVIDAEYTVVDHRENTIIDRR